MDKREAPDDLIKEIADSGDLELLTPEERATLPTPSLAKSRFTQNLAETLDESTLTQLGQDVYDGYTSDENSRADWRSREKIGIRLLGISENSDSAPAFDGGSVAIHPGLIEAIIQFQARTIAELWPPEGPAKAIVEGSEFNAERELQAKRVAAYTNWLYTKRMPGGYKHHDSMLFRLGLSGSAFKKIAFDASVGCVMSRFVSSEDVVVPYGASDLQTTPRITHILRMRGTDIERSIEQGVYRNVDLLEFSVDDEKTDLQPEIDAVAGSKPSQSSQSLLKTDNYILLEQSIITSLPGDKPSGPYLVTIERQSRKVLSVYRDWREDDESRKRRQRFVHYWLLPGMDGFYGLGFLHLVGRLAESMSGNLRALLDAATLANLQGGFRSADVRLPKGNRGDGLEIEPGAWKAVEATTEELQKLFVTIPYKEPSQTLFNLLHHLDELTRRVAGTTSELVGESTKNVPVGTTLARIEQGLKVQTAIQIRCHQAQTEELALVMDLTADTFPDAAYCRDVLNITPEQFAADFDSRIDIRPVSDPNAVTATQRLIIAQALVDRAAAAPDLYNRQEAERRLLEAMRVQDIDRLLVDRSQAPHMGPVEENMALTTLQPVKAYPDQDQQAHIIVHQQWLSTLDQDTLKRVQASAIAHIAEHMAWAYYLKMQQAMQVQLPAAPMGQPAQMTPEQENMLALMSAQAVQLMGQQQPPAIDPEAIQAASKTESERAKAEAEIRRKDALANAQIQRDDAQTIARMNRDVAEQEARLAAQFVSERARNTLGMPDQNGMPMQ